MDSVATTITPPNPSSLDLSAPNTASAPNDSESHAVHSDLPCPTSPSLRSTLSWHSIRSTISLSEKTSAQLGWIVALLSFLFTIIALSPAFRSQSASEKALQLAEWTALKDYIEECREELAAGIQSQACLKAAKANLPPPPYVKLGMLGKIRRDLLHWAPQTVNSTNRPMQSIGRGELQLPRAAQVAVFLAILLTACVFFFLSFETNRSRLRRKSSQDELENEQEQAHSQSGYELELEQNVTTGSVRYPPVGLDTTVRRRAVRTHPIYRHSTLGAAIHHADLAEIRIRLQNGEDMNPHWPYLIYRLAISPSSPENNTRLDIARLFLDFGADVNALKGWNGQSALKIAIHFGNVEIAKLLIANGALMDPNSNLTALHHCVRLAVTGSADDALTIMNMLFVHGANANQADQMNETPLHKLIIDGWFSRNDQKVILKLYPIALCLVRHGARVPSALEEKYVLGNPLWDLVHMAIWETEWPEHVGPMGQGRWFTERLRFTEQFQRRQNS